MSDQKFELQRVQGTAVSTEELTADLRAVADKAATQIVTARLYSQFGRYDSRTISRRFGTWNKAIEAAGLTIANEINISDDRLFANILDLWTHYGRQPRKAELNREPSLVSEGAYRRRWPSWMDALRAFVDFANAAETTLPVSLASEDVVRSPRDPSLRTRFRVLKRDNFSCRACGQSPSTRPGLVLHVDHITPWSKGGATVDDNLQTLCEPCNLGKSNVL